MVTIRHFVPNVAGLKYLWEKFNENRHKFTDDLPADPITFTCLLAATDTLGFSVGESTEDPEGFFMFTEIRPEEACAAHLFLWRKESAFSEYIDSAQVACMAMFERFGLQRIVGVTPTTHPHARIFAQKVGFKVQGTLRRSQKVKGEWVDAWIEDLLKEDLPEMPGSVTIDMRNPEKE